MTATVEADDMAVVQPTPEDTKGWQEAVADVRAALPETTWPSGACATRISLCHVKGN